MDKLKLELIQTLADIEAQAKIIDEHCRSTHFGGSPLELKYADGTYVYVPLLQAKANVLLALTNLKVPSS